MPRLLCWPKSGWGKPYNRNQAPVLWVPFHPAQYELERSLRAFGAPVSAWFWSDLPGFGLVLDPVLEPEKWGKTLFSAKIFRSLPFLKKCKINIIFTFFNFILPPIFVFLKITSRKISYIENNANPVIQNSLFWA